MRSLHYTGGTNFLINPTKSNMKNNYFSLVAISGALLLWSCGNNNTSADGDGTSMTTGTDTVSSATTTTTGSDTASLGTTGAGTNFSSTPLEKTDRDFVMKAASGGMMEVELGNIAQQNAASQRVKDFGSMMVRDHSKSNDELKSLASAKGLTLNADSLMNIHKTHIENLRKKTGADFDKSYMSMMVKDHNEDVNLFKKSSSGAADADLKGWAGKTLPVLQMHLDSAQAINKAKM